MSRTKPSSYTNLIIDQNGDLELEEIVVLQILGEMGDKHREEFNKKYARAMREARKQAENW